ncbi:protein HGH1 homolog [Agrilus planipennis]|uniref:Protein HGH1 homolog n=1 Tax=Agrilus planipennis TaxID=224129 RepID=A0A1W4XC44_AGRPL|nr:protein HGH1 homolog [Agrilus planipennis]
MSTKKLMFGLEDIVAVTSHKEGLEALIKQPNLLFVIAKLLKDKQNKKHNLVILILINVSAEEKGAEALLNLRESSGLCICKELFDFILNSEEGLSNNCCKVLTNLSHYEYLTERVIDALELSNISLDKTAAVFTNKNSVGGSAGLDYLGLFFSNLSQTPRGRKLILDEEKCILQRLLPYTEYTESLVCRKGIVGMIRNCCFETDFHKWLLSENVDILPRLLLPLADGTEFDEEDNDKLPIDLQYLAEDKQRDEDPEIRCMLLESLTLLCSKRENREYIRDKNTYVILRELHKWEQNKKALVVCENLVNILIRTEDEIGEDDLQQLEVPEDLQEKFNKFDLEILEEND